MRTLPIVLIALATLFVPLGATAQHGPSPESVVREYAATWNAGNFEAFLALHSADVRKYRRNGASSQFEQTTTGRDLVRQKYRALFAKTPRVQVEIVSMTALGDIVVTRDRVSGGADGHVSHELTMYEVREGLIQNIWYLGREVNPPQ
jgi:hypothetical protein